MSLPDKSPAVPFDLVIWNADECAAYLKLSTSRFLRTTRYADGFPQALKMDGHPKWQAIRVCEWALGVSRQNPPTEQAA